MAGGDSVLMSDGGEDKILNIFFDESFVPQAFVDILLFNAARQDINQVQSVTSSMLGRLDYYTKHLTKELESTIRKLESLSETLPGTWDESAQEGSSNEEYNSSSLKVIGGSSKLEYYLDTLGSAVRGMESDITKIDGKLDRINQEGDDSQNPIYNLENLRKIKERLLIVHQNFSTLKVILDISSGSQDAREAASKQLHLSLSDFKLSLKTLEETIALSLNKPYDEDGSFSEKNQDLLRKIELFKELKPLFRGLDKFYPVYSDFSDNIERSSQAYLSSKSVEDELNN
ncbi:hypothetical protein HG535_0E03860 [Zygotorulaspora mrakii]|uniref:Uncharacterized protein n=1 Tax=Zygotorulaspora mrakii TaxID=42260 RepID=A0A7H9B678_ZYGMR|nr:uncharacterized protein HG535_0E03860 [Zygotorulaspora mrakii]QLG73302.1 hypothetical protein HG535_0E03860 [Zygotorulaspora mrakii]